MIDASTDGTLGRAWADHPQRRGNSSDSTMSSHAPGDPLR